MNIRAFGSVPKGRFAVIAMVLALLMVSAYGFAGANTFAASSAGSSSTTISGYTVGDIAYTLDTTDAETLDKVSFTLTPGTGGAAATMAKAKVTSAGTTYTDCVESAGTWTCDVANTSVESANNLSVIAKS